jgi:hypothetical protein
MEVKTHIFFDTNILEIINTKDFSKFQFSCLYDQVLDLVKKYDLEDKVELYVSQIVIEEMLKHYKEDYHTAYNKAKYEIEQHNETLKTVLNKEIIFDPKYEKRKYGRFIKQNAKRYIEKSDIHVVAYPDNIEAIIKRSLLGKNPFHIKKLDGKKHKDSGFKDVIIWESVINSNFEQKDAIILFTEDNDFDGEKLKEDLKKNQFYLCRTIEQVEKSLMKAFKINEKYHFVYKKATTDYFIEGVEADVWMRVKNSYDYREIKDVSVIRDKIKVLNVTNLDIRRELEWQYGEHELQWENFWVKQSKRLNPDYLKVIVPVEVTYNDNKIKKRVKSSFNIECVSDLTDIISRSYPGHMLAKNKIIIGDIEK